MTGFVPPGPNALAPQAPQARLGAGVDWPSKVSAWSRIVLPINNPATGTALIQGRGLVRAYSLLSLVGAPQPVTALPGNPAAGADIVYALTASERIRSLRATFTASAAAANRTIALYIDDGAGHNLYSTQLGTAITAGQTADISWAIGAFQGAIAASTENSQQLPDLGVLPSGYRIRTSTAGIQAGDQWSNVVIELAYEGATGYLQVGDGTTTAAGPLMAFGGTSITSFSGTYADGLPFEQGLTVISGANFWGSITVDVPA